MKGPSVIPVKAGIQAISLDSRLRGNDERVTLPTFMFRCGPKAMAVHGNAPLLQVISASCSPPALWGQASFVAGKWSNHVRDRLLDASN